MKSVINASQGACAKLFAEESVITAWGWQEEAFDSPGEGCRGPKQGGGRESSRKEAGFLDSQNGANPTSMAGCPLQGLGHSGCS